VRHLGLQASQNVHLHKKGEGVGYIVAFREAKGVTGMGEKNAGWKPALRNNDGLPGP